MDARWGWALALAALAVGTWQYGWQGALMAVTVIVFWLLLQFGRALRATRNAAAAPKGRVASAVMVHSRLRPGLSLIQVLPLTRSLGDPVPPPEDAPAGEERFAWSDDSGARLVLTLQGGRLVHWDLQRPG